MNTTQIKRYPIEDMIATAVNNGFAKVRLRTKEFSFKAAPATGANRGAVYAYLNDEARTYIGKIRDGKISVYPTYQYFNKVAAIAENPQEAALKYGAETGSCSICGRPLVAKESVRWAIGPICAEKVGLAFITGQQDLVDSEQAKKEI